MWEESGDFGALRITQRIKAVVPSQTVFDTAHDNTFKREKQNPICKYLKHPLIRLEESTSSSQAFLISAPHL